MRRALLAVCFLGLVGVGYVALRRSSPRAAADSHPAGWLVLPAAPARITAPRALAVGGGRLYAFDDKGFIRAYDYRGHVLLEKHLVKTIRGFPNGAVREPDGNVLIADSHRSRLLLVNEYGRQLRTYGRGYGCLPGQFVYPQRIALEDGRAYVTEFGYPQNCRVQVFSLKGPFLFTFGTFGSKGPRFERPAGIAAGPQGRLYVADASHRILVWSRDGKFLFAFGGKGTAPGKLSSPWGVATDGKWLYVVEYGNHRVSRFTLDGKFSGDFGSKLLALPRDVAVAGPWLFIADTGHDRILRMKRASIPWENVP